MRKLPALYRVNRRLWNFLGGSVWTYGSWRHRQKSRELIDQELHYTELVDIATRILYQCQQVLANTGKYDRITNQTWLSFWNRNEIRDVARLEDLLQKIKKK